MKKKVTIHDLARILNIDSSTVSRALADSPRVKQKTRDLIQAKAKELGYSRNTLASNLRSQKTHTIGVIVPHISRFFLSTVIAGIEEIAYEKGYRVIICQSLDQLTREQEMVRALLSSQVDGIILSISMETDQFEHLESIQKQGIPVVFFDRKCEAIFCDQHHH
ncbi:LacI family transcriptional regulator [Reichenbachiella agarivorans]|uniref:LacI family transcriptional regulator n=1 Tax=Reichenbachiella agarivorans TaxID=2979464 RepID=A0ABY6CQI7_9BACT|nr:LacI family transcriptional regulator [Reichenbachiella agarivorans]